MIKRRIQVFIALGLCLGLNFLFVNCSPLRANLPSASSRAASSSGSGSGSNFFLPTTTVALETANNTSASDAYTDRYNMYGTAASGIGTNSAGGICTNVGQSSGKCVAGHVSRVPMSSLFSQPTKVFAYTQSWFDTSSSNVVRGALVDNAVTGSHIDIGYQSVQNVPLQVADMKRRGISGAIVNWYSTSKLSGQAAAAYRDAAERMLDSNGNPTFWFATGPDKGAFTCSPDCTTDAIAIVETIYANYITGIKSYIRDANGNPILYWFVDSGSAPRITDINWKTVKSALAAKGLTPVFIFDKTSFESGGLPIAGTDGGYAWVNETGVQAFTNFLNLALSVFANDSALVIAGGVGAGFDDAHASWGKNRVYNRACGQSWLKSIAAVNANINAMPYRAGIGITTWDDYEEGSEIETGIDNCVSSINTGLNGNILNWNVSFNDSTGTESTINNYTIYVSDNGQNLMPLATVSASTHSLDLATFKIPTGRWQLLVQAVGQPSIVDHISSAIVWTAP